MFERVIKSVSIADVAKAFVTGTNAPIGFGATPFTVNTVTEFLMPANVYETGAVLEYRSTALNVNTDPWDVTRT